MIHHTPESAIEWGEDEGVMTWREAVALAESKGDGWRLPTVAELVSMFDYDKMNAHALMERGWYWSSAVKEKDGRENVWRVSLGTGVVDIIFGDVVSCRVCLVRDIPVESIKARVVAKVDAIVGPTMEAAE